MRIYGNTGGVFTLCFQFVQVISNGYTNILDLCILSIRVMAATFPTHLGNI